MNDLVSVIVPVYNVAPYLEEALDSVLNQTYRNLEIIVVDDGSTDESGRICDTYLERDCRVKVIHQNNKGLSEARNIGIEKSSGQVIAFLDSDDAMYPEMIERLLREMYKKSVDIVVCGFSIHATPGKMNQTASAPVKPIRILKKNSALREVVDGKINTAPWNKLYRRKIWDTLRFPPKRVYEGTYVALDVFQCAERVAIINDVLIRHRNRCDSICNTYSLKLILDGEQALNHNIAFITKNIPSVFSQRQLVRLERKRTHDRLINYLYYVSSNPKDIYGCRILYSILRSRETQKRLKWNSFLVKAGYYSSLVFPRLSVQLYGLLREKRKCKKKGC